MSDSQFTQYTNLQIFAEKWRKYAPVNAPLDLKKFKETMQTEQYVKLEYLNHKTGRPVLIYLLSKTSKYMTSSPDLKRLLARIKERSDVILVSYQELRTYSRRAFNAFKHLKISTYLHVNFDLIVPEGPLCYPHRILSREEVQRLLNEELCCSLINLPKIHQEDVQCIWIGAEVGDVIEITLLSDINAESIQYRVVVPRSGRIVSFRMDSADGRTTKISSKKERDAESKENQENAEEEDAEITEYREAALDEDAVDAVDDDADADVDGEDIAAEMEGGIDDQYYE